MNHDTSAKLRYLVYIPILRCSEVFKADVKIEDTCKSEHFDL